MARIVIPCGKKAALYGLTLCASAFALIPAPAQAQQAQINNAAIGQVDAGRVQERLQPEGVVPSVSPAVEVRDIILQDMPEGAEGMCFALEHLEIEGVAAYDQTMLRPLYSDFLGNDICLSDLYAIATRLTNKYRNEGFILTQVYVPPQTIENGKATLRVLEGYLDSVSVEAGTGVSESELGLIRNIANSIPTGSALNARELERFLLLINDLPGVSARSVLSAVEGKTGAAALRIVVERKAYDVFMSLDNYGSRYLGPVQGMIAASANSFFGLNERITGQFVLAPDSRELAYGYLGYSQPINRYGTKINLGVSHTSTEPGYDLEEFDVKGKARSYTAEIAHPFIRSRSRNLYGYALFDWRDVTSKNILEPNREDRVRALRAGATYEFLDTFWKVGVNSINLELSQGLNVFGASEEGRPFLSRTFGDPQFTKMTAELQRLQNLTPRLNLLIKAKGQISNKALLSSEEFGIGGMDIGRGYDSSEIIGDEGIAGKAELQWNSPYQVDFLHGYQLFGFFDAGRIWNDDATSSSTKTDTLTSTGMGLRADITPNTKAAFTFAVPLNREVQTMGDQDPRYFFSLNHSF